MSRWPHIAVLSLCVVLASCAAQATKMATSTATPFPCSFSNATPNLNATPTALEVVRPYNHLLALPAFSRCIQNDARVQQLYAAALALPPRAPGYYSCPKSWDLNYYLTFLAGANVVRMMTLEADGCEFLHVSDTDVRANTGDFDQQFADAIGLPVAQAFAPFQRP